MIKDLEEVCLLSQSDDVSIRIRFITKRHSLFLPSSTRIPFELSYELLTSNRGEIRAYHVPFSKQNGLGLTFSPVEQHPRSIIHQYAILSTHLLVTAYQYLWLLMGNDDFTVIHLC